MRCRKHSMSVPPPPRPRFQSHPHSALSELSRTTLSSALCKYSGSCFPLLVARLKIPCAAFGDSENFFRCSPCVSKTSDNEDSTTTLGDSEVLSIKHPPSHAIPATDQRFNDDGHVSSVIGGKKARHVFEDNRLRSCFVKESADFPEKSTPFSCQSCSLTGNR